MIGVLVLVIVLTTATARAQIVNIQGALARPPASDRAIGLVEPSSQSRSS